MIALKVFFKYYLGVIIEFLYVYGSLSKFWNFLEKDIVKFFIVVIVFSNNFY